MYYTRYIVSEATAQKAKLESINKDLRNSIRGRENGYVARLGELLVAKVTGGAIQNTYDYDVVLKNGIKIDVKTKERSVDPKPHYEVSIADFNTRQKCDAYVFVSVNTKSVPNTAFIVGWLNKADFYSAATFHKKNEYDPSNNFIFKADCYNVKFKDLNPIESLWTC